MLGPLLFQGPPVGETVGLRATLGRFVRAETLRIFGEKRGHFVRLVQVCHVARACPRYRRRRVRGMPAASNQFAYVRRKS